MTSVSDVVGKASGVVSGWSLTLAVERAFWKTLAMLK